MMKKSRHWSDFDFGNGWFIQQTEHIVGYRVNVIFENPLDLRHLMTLRRVCPGLQSRSVTELKDSLLGEREFSLGEIRPDNIKTVRDDLESAGFNLDISPLVSTTRTPVRIRGRHAVEFDVEDSSTRQELMFCLENLPVPRAPASLRPIRVSLQGDRTSVIEKLRAFLDYRPRKQPDSKPAPLQKTIRPTFKYIDETILEAYARHDWCPGCDVYSNVFWLWRELIIEGKQIEAESACVDCLRRHPITAWDADRTRGAIRGLVNSYFRKGELSGAEREGKVESIFVEFMATPRLPNFIQRVDWPSCCGDFAQFVGDAGNTHDGPFENFVWWGDREDEAIDRGIEGMMGGEDSVSLFQCLNCPKKFWIFQCT